MTELFAEEAPGTAFTLPGDEVHDLVRSLVVASASSPGGVSWLDRRPVAPKGRLRMTALPGNVGV
jgi:hypothetical protein